MKESFEYAWRETQRRRGRFVGNMLGYMLAVAIMVVVASAILSTRDAVVNVLWDMGAHTMAYVSRCTTDGCPAFAIDPDREGFVANNAPADLISADLVDMIRRSPNVKDASPYLMFRIRATLGSGGWIVGGFDLERPDAYSATVVAKAQVVEGDFLQPDQPGQVMVEQEFAKAFNLSVGSPLRLGERQYTVAAVVNPPLRPGKANIYMEIEDLRQLINTRVEQPVRVAVNAVLVESKGAKYHERANSDVSRILGKHGHISSYGCYEPGVLAMGIHEKTAWLVTVFVALAMMLLTLKTQYSSVVERRHDIGILKAIGWSDRNVVRQLLAESMIQAVGGGVLGCLLAVALLLFMPAQWLLGSDVSGSISINPLLVLLGLAIALAGGLMAGVLPGWSAARVRPADILRRL